MVANAKKVIGIEEMQKLILIKLCKSDMAGYQKLEILQMPRTKIAQFLKRLYVDIEKPLPVTFSSF